MTSPEPRTRPALCTCTPRTNGYHGIVLHADEVDDLIHLLGTFEDWLIHASEDVHDDLRAFLPERPHRVDEFITHIGTTTTVLIRAGHDPQLAWTPC
jgi:hypothetical protein